MKRHFFALVLIVSCVFGFAQARRSEAGRAQTADAADSHVPITIKIGSAAVSGVLYGTVLAAEIKSRFPLAVSMSDFAPEGGVLRRSGFLSVAGASCRREKDIFRRRHHVLRGASQHGDFLRADGTSEPFG